MADATRPSCGELALRACVAEVAAPKAGNVSLIAEFDDAEFSDFVVSASVNRPILDDAPRRPLGQTVLECIRATRDAVGTNTNLGIVLLLAPLCKADAAMNLQSGAAAVLQSLTEQDATDVYEAIRLAAPGGLGDVDHADVREEPTLPLIEAMALASSHDRIAAQYARGFADVFDPIASTLALGVSQGMPLDDGIVRMHLELIAQGDTLIARKCGGEVAAEAARRAKAVCDAGWPANDKSQRLFDELDAWLRADGRRRNPGTSADLIAAGLYVCFRLGWIAPPLPWRAAVHV